MEKLKENNFWMLAVITILAIGILVLVFNYLEQSDYVSELENTRSLQAKTIEDYEATLTDYEASIQMYEDERSRLSSTVTKLNESISSLGDQYKELSDYAKALENDNGTLYSYETLLHMEELTSKYYEFEVLTYNHSIIRPNMSENEVIAVFGKPYSEEVEIDDGSSVGHRKGYYWKTAEYKDFTLYYLGDQSGENYELHSYATNSDQVSTLHNIKVGDSLENLLSKYPTLIETEYPDGKIRYAYPEGEYMIRLEFEVKEDIIVEMMYFGYN